MTERPAKSPVRVTRVAAVTRSPWAEARRWMRQSFTRENASGALATMVWVVPLSILIWVYAAENTMSDSPLWVDVSLVSSDPKQVLILGSDRSVQLTLHGPQASMQQIVQELSQAGSQGLQVPVDEQLQIGSVQLNSVMLLNRAPVFIKHGVSVSACNPNKLNVFVDQLAERDVPVVLPADPNLNLTAVFDPPTVTLSGPSRAIAEADTAGHLSATADLSSFATLQPGQHTDVTVHLLAPTEGPGLKLSTQSVKATVNVREADEHLTLPSVPIWPCQPNILTKYRINFSPATLTNIEVFGPHDKIALLKGDSPQFTPIAWFRVTREDVGRPSTPRQLKFDLPDGVRVSDTDAKRTVDVDVTDQPAQGD